ncbi:hypothetical protein SKAU_G00253090 [Synaphobranchus kaupii]|uniref:Uncharacterized protein n=1 Tax=Synaphobranchus kaupii TaxID=118154 RepID=A0A9Q1IPZ6_SYNKA|nr:hypothetical protein SKAU_G00253090 [Synaphobranchus kaupii]
MEEEVGGPCLQTWGPSRRCCRGPHFLTSPQPGDFNMGPNRQFLGIPHGPQGPGNMRGPRGEQPFGPEQRTNMGGNGRLGHLQPPPPNQLPNTPGLSVGPPQAQRGLGRKPSDLSGQAGPVNPLKSPPLRQSPMLGSPSGNLMSPQTPSQLAGMLSGPPAPPAASISKPPLSMTSPNMMANMEQGGNGPPPAPPSSNSSSQPGSINLPGSLPSGSPYNLPPEPTLSQNPLSIMMSRMSKFAMPTSTPLYHDAIKTVASSDDDSPPARSPNLPNSMPGMAVNHLPGHPRMMGPMNPALSPMGMNSMGQPLSHTMPGQLPSPNPMGSPHDAPTA